LSGKAHDPAFRKIFRYMVSCVILGTVYNYDFIIIAGALPQQGPKAGVDGSDGIVGRNNDGNIHENL